MIRTFLFSIFVFSSLVSAKVPEPTITNMDGMNGFALVAGRLVSKPESPVGISVRNGNVMYSTITDLEGRWGIVIRHSSVNVQVESWDLKHSDDRSQMVEKLF